ncbi:MAG: hypothetical protein HOM58_02685 [Rhodospirillaceae bacterium]|jgi:hypothetical protein|nr:hypothetical protein [Rhodospirillaceae bacterium]MBT5455028.1 hypothetical protein [Rhodospirillaceae bacterium]MBT7486437.1 hypothetical protein [Rhodospirillales bacterium]MBT8004023.1 hypothetical protein [Rhodospirillales bacterium]
MEASFFFNAIQAMISVGALTLQVYVIHRRIKMGSDETADTSDKGIIAIPKVGLKGSQNFLDLSFVLLVGALVTMLVTDSLVVSGRSLSLTASLILSWAVGLTILLSLIAMWRHDQAEFGVGCWAVVAFLLLIFSEGGPFQIAVKGAIKGPDLLIPLTILLFLAASTITSEYGSPLSSSTPRKQRVVLGCLFLVCLITGSIFLGKQSKDTVLKDPRAPNISAPAVASLVQKIDKLPSEFVKRRFYQLSSEVNRDHIYRSAVAVKGGKVSDSRNSEVGVIRQELLDQFGAGYISRITLEDPDGYKTFFTDRLAWVYPVGGRSAGAIRLDMPGNTSEDRLKNTALLTINHALASEPYLKEWYTNVFGENFFIKGAKASSEDNGIISSFIAGGHSDRRTDLFPNLPERPYKRWLQAQLALPSNYENYIAGQIYENFALDAAKQNFSGDFPKNTKVIGQIIDNVLRLTDVERRALLKYFVYTTDGDRRLRVVGRLSQAQKKFFQKLKTNAKFRTFANELELRSQRNSGSNEPTSSDAVRCLTSAPMEQTSGIA